MSRKLNRIHKANSQLNELINPSMDKDEEGVSLGEMATVGAVGAAGAATYGATRPNKKLRKSTKTSNSRLDSLTHSPYTTVDGVKMKVSEPVAETVESFNELIAPKSLETPSLKTIKKLPPSERAKVLEALNFDQAAKLRHEMNELKTPELRKVRRQLLEDKAAFNKLTRSSKLSVLPKKPRSVGNLTNIAARAASSNWSKKFAKRLPMIGALATGAGILAHPNKGYAAVDAAIPEGVDQTGEMTPDQEYSDYHNQHEAKMKAEYMKPKILKKKKPTQGEVLGKTAAITAPIAAATYGATKLAANGGDRLGERVANNHSANVIPTNLEIQEKMVEKPKKRPTFHDMRLPPETPKPSINDVRMPTPAKKPKITDIKTPPIKNIGKLKKIGKFAKHIPAVGTAAALAAMALHPNKGYAAVDAMVDVPQTGEIAPDQEYANYHRQHAIEAKAKFDEDRRKVQNKLNTMN